MKRSVAVFAAAALAALVLIVVSADLSKIPAEHDGSRYGAMAAADDARAGSPFRHRVLVPEVVDTLPLPVPWGFAVATAFALGVTFAALDRLLRRFVSARAGLMALGVFAVGGFVQSLMENPFYVDAWTMAAASLVFIGLVERRWWLVAAVIPAVAAHEMALVLLVPILLVAERHKAWLQAGAVSVGAVGMWWLLHRSGWIVPVSTSTMAPWVAEAMIEHNVNSHGSIPGAIRHHAVGGFGALWVLAAFGWNRGPRVIRQGAWMAAPSLVLMLFASDWGRMLLPLTPVMVVLAGVALDREREEARTSEEVRAV